MKIVTTLRPTLTANERTFAVMRTFLNTIDELKALKQSNPDELRFYLMELDRADTDLKLVVTGLKPTTMQLCGQFGKAP